MEVQLKTHTKIGVGEVGVGKTFRLINQMKAFQVIDLTKLVLPDGQGGGRNIVELPANKVFAIDLSTGIAEHFVKETEVYLCPMRAIEGDEE